MIPDNWEDFLNSQVFIINLDRKPERLTKSIERAYNAGFKNVERFKAIDGINDDMELIWKSFNNPKFNEDDTQFIDKIHHSHHQAICLSHLSIYKKIIENNIDFSVIFEDDIVFHKDWSSLGSLYYKNTPKDFDMCYIGHHCGCGFNSIIA
jgi:GR25 family glycosyltransferase involved in LPS biosynthesis